ncbi:hypothetical protein SAMN04515674_11222 [Pseudarcicella hirudinis]|uniref:Outer membrane protein beta-barrel domain-containing protein n=1 Tax=Pseudarcicella hirudinis TaxID=1079859 RepID=A0A1I5WL57_9BACT|nr:outer membrane beta-barrel protein [Pseudarcicella hirudinis]SFQ20307.1 hypothetical protein SAMN04515674_11222 [Pseudarcicella hirudinis]
MKKAILILTTMLLLALEGFASSNDNDSTIVNIDKRNQVVIGSEKSKSRTLREDLTDLFQSSGLTLDDETWKGIRKVINSDLERDTVLLIKQNDKALRLAINATVKNQVINSGNSDKGYLKRDNTSDGVKDYVKVGIKGVHVKDGSDEVHVGWNGVYVKDGNEETKVIWGKDSTKIPAYERAYSGRGGFNIYFGLNAFSSSPAGNPNYELSPFGSRYFALEMARSATLSRNGKSALKLGYGFEFSWYNFMFDGNKYILKGQNEIEFASYLDNTGKEIPLSKNKMTVAYVNLPIVPYIAFSKDNVFNYIGAGVYVGYRLDSYIKTIEQKSDELRRDHSSLYLNNVRYGLRLELGLKNFPDLFVNYDLGNLFQENKSPKVTAISFGIKL